MESDLTEDHMMRAAVYVGNGRIKIQSVPVPEIGPPSGNQLAPGIVSLYSS